MPTPTKGARLGGAPSHERALLANLATALFEHGAITTTEAKARRLRPYAERLITKAKRGDLAARRQVMTLIRDKGVVHSLFTEIGPRFGARSGGYTRITKIGPRKGDAAPMAVISLVEPLSEAVVAEASAATRRAASTPAASRPAPSATAAGQPAVGQPAADQSAADQQAAGQQAADQAATGESVDDVPASAPAAAAGVPTGEQPAGAAKGSGVEPPPSSAAATATPVAPTEDATKVRPAAKTTGDV